MSRPKREPRAVTVAEIAETFELASYWWGGKWCPAVAANTRGGYSIRVVRSETATGTSRNISYNYFEIDPDGTITAAPHGHAKHWKPGKVTDIEAAAKAWQQPRDGAPQFTIGGRPL